MKTIILILLIYISFDLFAYFNRDNGFIGEWEVVKVYPDKTNSAGRLYYYMSKYSGTKMFIYANNNDMTIDVSGNKRTAHGISYKEKDGKIYFGVVADQDVVVVHGSHAYFKTVFYTELLKRDYLYYITPDFIEDNI